MSKTRKELDTSNPLIQQIVTGGVTPNPKYDPTKKGTKKKPAQPKYLVDKQLKPTASSVWDAYAREGQKLNYDATDLGLTPNQYESYTERGITPGPQKTMEDLNLARAKTQGFIEQSGRALGQAVGNEVILGTALGLSNLFDAAVNIATPAGENDYTNPLSTALEETQTKVRERLEIYREDPNATWAIDDFGWWADNSVSIASSASMLLPSIGTMKGLSILGRATKASTRISELAKVAGLTKNAGKLAKTLESGSEIFGSALLSRTMEGYQEARGVYNETYDKNLERVKKLSDEERSKLISNNPELADKTDEEVAGFISGKSADETFKNDYAMLLMDVAQFKALGSMWKGLKNKDVSGTLRRKQQEVINSLSKETEGIKTGGSWLANRRESINNAIKNPATSLGAIQLSEGFEEGYQGAQTEKGKEISELMFDPNFKTRDIESYVADQAIWEQAFWGVLGGVGFQAVGTALGNASSKIKGKIDKANMSDKDYALTQMTDEKRREIEIESRKTAMQSYTDAFKLLNEGKSPFSYKVDPVSGNEVLENGQRVNTELTPQEVNLGKIALMNELVTDMTLNAVDAGNFDLLKEFIKDKNFNKFFEEAGVDTQATNALSSELSAQMNRVSDVYDNNLSTIFNSIEDVNPNVAQILARDITRKTLLSDKLNSNINEINESIVKASNGQDYFAYESNERNNYYKDELDRLDNLKVQVKQDLDNKNISPTGYTATIQDIDQRRKAILKDAVGFTSFGEIENIKDNLKNIGNSEEVNSFAKEFENYYREAQEAFNNQQSTISKANTPPKEVQNLIKDLIEAEANKNYNDSLTPKSQQDYENQYKDKSESLNTLAKIKMIRATQRVIDFIESNEDLNLALEQVLSHTVPEDLIDNVAILKLGHNSTHEYLKMIVNAVRDIDESRREQAKQEAKVTVNNKIVTPAKANEIKAEVESIAQVVEPEPEVIASSTGGLQQAEPITIAPIDPLSQAKVPDPSSRNVDGFVNEDVESLNREINSISKAEESLIREQAQELIDNVDFRADDIAVTVAMDVFKNNKELYIALEDLDNYTENLNELVNTIARLVEDKGVSSEASIPAARGSISTVVNLVRRRLEYKKDSKANRFKAIADQLANKAKYTNTNSSDSDIKFSVIEEISDSNIDNTVDEFIEAYIELKDLYRPRGGRPIINLNNVFEELITSSDISYTEAKQIFHNIRDYVNSSQNKYVFTNKRDLNKAINNPSSFFESLISNKSTVEKVATYMHMSIPTKTGDGYLKAVNDAMNGEEVSVDYTETANGKSFNSISIKRNGIEIGFFATVVGNSTGTGYSLRRQNVGFVYNVDNTENGFVSNFDDLFESIINSESENDSKMMTAVYNQYLRNIAVREGFQVDPISNEEASLVLNYDNIVKLRKDSKILLPSRITTNNASAEYILKSLADVIFYDKESLTKADFLDSYNYWKDSMFNNYDNTFKMQQSLDSGQRVTTKLVSIKSGKVILDSKNNDINTYNFNSTDNPIMIVDANGNIINENNNITYSNPAGFMPGSMGVLIRDNPSAPIIAAFTDSNTLSSNTTMLKEVDKEIQDLLTSYQNKVISFEDISKSFGDLMGGPKASGSNLFHGLSVIQTNNSLALAIDGRPGEYLVIINKNKAGSVERGTRVVYLPNGNTEKAVSSVRPTVSTVSTISKAITDKLKFNRTFYGVNNRNVQNENSNKYIYKEEGKFIVDIGGAKRVYNSFGDFAIRANAFKTNQGRNSEGGFFNIIEGARSLFVDVARINIPVEEVKDQIIPAVYKSPREIVETAGKDGRVQTIDLINSVGGDLEQARVLMFDNDQGLDVIPQTIKYDPSENKGDAYYSKGDVYLTSKGIRKINRPTNLFRLLIHEQLHDRFNKEGLFNNNPNSVEVVRDLLETYNQFINSITAEASTADDATVRQKQAQNLLNWIESSNFKPDTYINRLPKSQQTAWNKRSDEERAALFAEEWITESLSQGAIMKYLNDTNYIGDTMFDPMLNNESKSLLQHIFDILTKLFIKDSGVIQNNSILAKQYTILNNNNYEIEVIDKNTNQSSIANTNNEKVGELDTKIDGTEVSNIENPNNNNQEITETVNARAEDVTIDESIEETIEENNDDNIWNDFNTGETDVDSFNFSINDYINDINNVNDDNTQSVESDKNTTNSINKYKSTVSNINTSNINVINNMNDYLARFNEQDKAVIAKMIAHNELKFECEL